VERNLYWVTDGTYQSAFLITKDGVVLFDAPPTIGHNIQRAVDEIAKANGVSNKVTHLVNSHHHDTLMLIDIVNPGWAPVYISNLTEDVPGYVAAPATALTYPWKHYIGGHLGRLGTRDDVILHQQSMADIESCVRDALPKVDPTPFFQKYGENTWAAVKGYLDACTDAAAAPVIEKYRDVLAAADVFTPSTTFWVMESIRLDLGFGSYVHP
jgi:hypothetical protein